MREPLVVSLPLDAIDRDAAQPRTQIDPGDLDSLTESVRRCGVLQPIRVRRSDERWVLIDGERRWCAAKAAGLESIPVVVEDGNVNEAAILTQQLAANLARRDLDPIEKAIAIRRTMDLGDQSMAEVARAVGISESSASKHLALLTLSPDEQQRVREGTLGLVAAYRLARKKEAVPMPSRHRPATSERRKPKVRRPRRLRIERGIALVLAHGHHTPGSLADALAPFLSRLRSAQFQDATLADFLRGQSS